MTDDDVERAAKAIADLRGIDEEDRTDGMMAVFRRDARAILSTLADKDKSDGSIGIPRDVEALATALYDHMRPDHPLPFHACENAVAFIAGPVRAQALKEAAERHNSYMRAIATAIEALGDKP